jgi:hypothetical protein
MDSPDFAEEKESFLKALSVQIIRALWEDNLN